MKFPSLSGKIDGYYVESATLTVYETAKSNSGAAHKKGYYNHYHDSKHVMHIWYGGMK